MYQTLLGSGANKPAPVIVVDQVIDTLNSYPSKANSAAECFQNGLDTVKVVLFNAPYTSDSVQQLFVSAAGLSSATESFALLPASLHTLALEDNSGNNLGDSITMRYPGDSRIIVSEGFDMYGNKIGPQNAVWNASGTLHAISQNTNVSRIYYESSNVKGNEQGYIRAKATDATGTSYGDAVFVTIIGPAPRLLSATTRDVSGDGYLDEIVLVYSARVPVPAASSVSVAYPPVNFSIDSVKGVAHADSDSIIIVYLVENKTGVPQSAWRPLVTLRGASGSDTVTAADGAGPVVWSVVKSISNISDRTQDLVTVAFSEPIQTANGNLLTAALTPSQIFNVWSVSGAGDTTPANGVLAGITSLYRILDSKTIQFYMSNGSDLTDKNLLSLRSDTPGVADMAQSINAPVPGNQRVDVKVNTTFPELLQAAPNPATATTREEAPGVLHCANNPLARTWVRVDNAGVVMTFKLMPLSNTSEPIKASLTIYDYIGNLVNSDQNGNILPSAWQTGGATAHDLDLYWNGTNKKGMIVAAGVYRVILSLESTSDKRKLIGTIGIRR